MNNQSFSIFLDSPHQLWMDQDDCLDLNEFLLVDSTNPNQQEQPQSPPFQTFHPYEDIEFVQFFPILPPAPINNFIEAVEESTVQDQEREAPKSIATKNVCFNICQKTVRVIQKGEYDSKLIEICKSNAVDKIEFIQYILKQKKNFTGPKALQMFVEQESPMSQTFRVFMKWFLKEKYLRHCMKGDMKDKQAYIKYKNEVVLVILG